MAAVSTPGWGWEFLTRPEHNRFWLVVGFVVRRRAELTVITVSWLVFVQLDSHVTPGLPGWMTPAQWAWLLMAATARGGPGRTGVPPVHAAPRHCGGDAASDAGLLPADPDVDRERTTAVPDVVPPDPVSGFEFECGSRPGCRSTTSNASSTSSAPPAGPAKPASPRSRGQAALVVVDIIRRDPLGAEPPAVPPVVDHLDPDGAPDLAADADGGLSDTSGHLARAVDQPVTPTVVPPDRRTASTAAPTAQNGAAQQRAPRRAPAPAGAQADPPGVTGFGGVDVTDYV